MIISLDDLRVCECGNVYDFVKASYRIGKQCDYANSPIYYGKCPACKKEYEEFI